MYTAVVELKLLDYGCNGERYVNFRFTDSQDAELLAGKNFDEISEYVKRKVEQRLDRRGYEKLIPRFAEGLYDFEIDYKLYTLH